MSIANLKGKENVFSKRLKDLMSNNEVTQEKLAEILNVKRQTISLYVNGSSLPPLEKFLEIANYFDVSTDYLLGKDDDNSIEDSKAKIGTYTGLNNSSLERLHKCFERNDKSFACLINFIISDFEILSVINEYYKAFVIEEIKNNETYKYIPLKEMSTTDEILRKKIYFANIIEKLPLNREKFIDSLTLEEKNNIVMSYLFRIADISICKETVFGHDTEIYQPTDKDLEEVEVFYEDWEKEHDLAMEEALKISEKTRESILWFLPKYEEFKNKFSNVKNKTDNNK